MFITSKTFVKKGFLRNLTLIGVFKAMISINASRSFVKNILKCSNNINPLLFNVSTRKLASGKAIITPVQLSYNSYEQLYKSNGANTADPVIVIHGLFGSKANWNSLCKAMHAKTNPCRRVISVDARNHGDSPHSPVHTYPHMAADLVQLMANLEIEKAAVIGHSMGGRAMAYLALKYPQLVDRVIIVDVLPATGLGTTQTDITLFLQAMKAIQVPKELTIHQGRKFADAKLQEIISEQSLRDFLITNLMKDDADGEFRWRINIEALEENFIEHIATFPDSTGLKYEGKTLFIGGSKSDYISKEGFNETKQLFPNAKLVYIEGAGHWVHSQKPNEFLELVLQFLNDKS